MIFDAALSPAEIALLPQRDLSRTTCVVFDVLRATSAMVTGLANGVLEIWPVNTIEEARALHEKMPDAVLAGERNGDAIEGFDLGNNPLEFLAFNGRRIIATTTNGTVALRSCENAERVLVGALLNLGALAAALVDAERVLCVCAGTFETFALEDAIGAGELMKLFPAAERTDAARVCEAAAQAFASPLDGLLVARNGRALMRRGWGEQVEWCARCSQFSAVGIMNGEVIRAL